MKLVKSLLLGSAAGIVAVAGASAADLGVKKPSAVEYVKTCPTYGAGFFVVPGTTSCLKLIGRVRVDYVSGPQGTRHNNAQTGLNGGGFSRATSLNALRARGYFGYDHRTATEYGLLRTYVRAAFDATNGAEFTFLEYAFIQFGGLTVGRVTPNFEHGWNPTFLGSATGGHADNAYVNAMGYTFNAGGFSATVAIEGGAEHRNTIVGGGGYAGQSAPDVVGTLAYTASWGEVKASGAIHELRAAGLAGAVPSTRYGFAVALGAKINIPMAAAGSYVWLNGSYADGATQYAGFYNNGATIGSFNVSGTVSDAIVSGGSLRLTKAWAVAGGAKIQFTPTVFGSITGTYAVHNAFATGSDFRTYTVIGQVGWQPVAGMLIAGEAGYRAASGVATVAVAPNRSSRNDWIGRIRFQRDF